MTLADDILERISRAGFVIYIPDQDARDADFFVVQATDPASRMTWAGSGDTPAEAATALAHKLGIAVDHADVAPPGMLGLSPQGELLMIWSLVITAVLFFVDLLLPGINLGIFYLLPLGLANHARLKRPWMLLLACLMVAFVFLDALVGEQSLGAPHAEPAMLTNRGFAAAVILFAAAVMPLRNSIAKRRMTSTLQWGLGVCAFGLVVATFAGDLATPLAMNLSILYLAPLSILSILMRPGVVRGLVPVLLATSLVGYLVSPQAGLSGQDVSTIMTNRIVTGAMLVAAAFLWTRERRLAR